jgi:glycosyltransferase involved in cell wall biosynthesis
MNNLQIGDNDLIGNRFNGHDLHLYLRERGIVSDHFVKFKRSGDPHTHVLCEDIPDRLRYIEEIAAFEKKYGTHSLHFPFGFSLFSEPLFLDADVVHYHLIHNFFFNLSLLPALTALKPSVWTIHDPWVATGRCIHPLDCERWKTGCGDCPYPNTDFRWPLETSALNWELKRDALARSQVELVVASRFMLDLLKQSPLLSHQDIHLIPFGIDLKRFAPCDGSEARKRLGIPPENVVICFRADQSIFKGFSYIEQALQTLDDATSITLITVGCVDTMNEYRSRFQVIERGWTTDDEEMLEVYRAADIFLMPSVAEAFGMMAIETMAFGKPVIVFEGTALYDTVFAPQGGIAVPAGDAQALVRELKDLIANREKRLQLGEQARKLAEIHYDKDTYVSRIVDLYKETIAKRKIDERSMYILAQQKRAAGKAPYERFDVGVESAPTCSEQELAQIKSSLYFKAYEKLRHKKVLRAVSNAAVKPAIKASWWMYKKVKKMARL